MLVFEEILSSGNSIMILSISISTIITRYFCASWVFRIHCKPIPCNDYRDFPVYWLSQGNPCNEYRFPAMRRGVPCNENRFFPVRISTQGKPCSGPVLALYGIAVWSIKYLIYCWLYFKLIIDTKRVSRNISIFKRPSSIKAIRSGTEFLMFMLLLCAKAS